MKATYGLGHISIIGKIEELEKIKNVVKNLERMGYEEQADWSDIDEDGVEICLTTDCTVKQAREDYKQAKQAA
jgi:hypothetical protein